MDIILKSFQKVNGEVFKYILEFEKDPLLEKGDTLKDKNNTSFIITSKTKLGYYCDLDYKSLSQSQSFEEVLKYTIEPGDTFTKEELYSVSIDDMCLPEKKLTEEEEKIITEEKLKKILEDPMYNITFADIQDIQKWMYRKYNSPTYVSKGSIPIEQANIKVELGEDFFTCPKKENE